MKIHKEGYITIIIAEGLLIVINLIAIFFCSSLLLKIILGTASIFLLGLIINFFRNPTRNISPDNSVIVSPADGKIVVNEELEETEFLNTRCRQISIFMSVWNVHANRFPVSGKIIASKYRPGKYLMAINPKSSELNEAHTTVIETAQKHKIAVKQIAGIMARRIVCYAKENEDVTQGNELGFIKFGSRVDIFLPLDYKVKVKIGDKVKGNKNIIAEI